MRVLCCSGLLKSINTAEIEHKGWQQQGGREESPQGCDQTHIFQADKNYTRKKDSVHSEMFIDCYNSGFSKPTRAHILQSAFYLGYHPLSSTNTALMDWKGKKSSWRLALWKQNVGMADFRCTACIPCRSPCLSSKPAVRYYELIYSRSIRHTPSMLSLTNTITSYMTSLQRHNGSLWTCTVAVLLFSERNSVAKYFRCSATSWCFRFSVSNC